MAKIIAMENVRYSFLLKVLEIITEKQSSPNSFMSTEPGVKVTCVLVPESEML